MANKSIACIGQGFVGGSLTTVMSERDVTVFAYDKTMNLKSGGQHPNYRYGEDRLVTSPNPILGRIQPTLQHFVEACERTNNFSKIYFVCLPTPMYDDGEADLSIVEGVLQELANIPGERIAVVKSTVPPGSTDKWNEKFNDQQLHIVFSPEFLTEKNAINDFREQTRIILGGPRPWINEVKEIFYASFPNIPIIKTSSSTAEMVKYFTNIQLATRVVLSCEFWKLCNHLQTLGKDIDYDKVLEYASYDHRLGGSHMTCPGENGIPSARGHCFPKDLAALIFMANSVGYQPKLFEAVQSRNLEFVPSEHRDWEKMVGRAFKIRDKK